MKNKLMKKTYIAPTMDIVNIDTMEMMIAASQIQQTLNNNEPPIDDPNDIGSRSMRNSLWDDEEENW